MGKTIAQINWEQQKCAQKGVTKTEWNGKEKREW